MNDKLAKLLEYIQNTDDKICGGYGFWEMNSDECETLDGNCTLCKVTKALKVIWDTTNPEECDDTCIYKRFAANMKNADAHDAKIREATIAKCRSVIGDRIMFGKCPKNGDCGVCFLCDNAGGCIIKSDAK
jgi:hypothetical protein